MRKIASVGQWMLCILVFTTSSFSSSELFSPSEAHAKGSKGKKSKKNRKQISRCVSFSQSLGENERSVDFTLTNSCESEVICDIEWKLLCDDDTEDEPASHTKLSQSLSTSDTWEPNASASSCEGDWRISAVRWNCASGDTPE